MSEPTSTEQYQSINRHRRYAYVNAGGEIRAAILASVRKYGLTYRDLVLILAQEIIGWQKDTGMPTEDPDVR